MGNAHARGLAAKRNIDDLAALLAISLPPAGHQAFAVTSR
jgi:hypothetical protein